MANCQVSFFLLFLRIVVYEKSEIPYSGNVLFVLSSDLSHFHSRDVALTLDEKAAKLIEIGQSRDFSRHFACGHAAIRGFLMSNIGHSARAVRLSNSDSAVVTKDETRVVGYGSWAF